MSIERLQAGAQSATYFIKLPAALGLTDWEALPEGKLKTLLTGSYPTVGMMSSQENFLRAFAAAGGSVSAITSGTIEVVYPCWSMRGFDNTAGLSIVPNGEDPMAPNGVVIRIQVSYSASE